MADAPIIQPPTGVISNFDHPQDVLRSVNIATQYLSISIVSIFVAFRLFVKAGRLSGLNVEDYITLVAWVLFVAFCVCMLLLSYHGGGYHAWDVRMYQFIPFMKLTYAITIIYVPMAFCVKAALLSIIIRVFAPAPKKVIAIYAILVTLFVYYIVSFLIKVFFCHPISAYWEGTQKGGSCLNQQKVIIADSVISMISDLLILTLPLPLAWDLHMPKMKKIKVMGILGAGGIATAFSVWRLVIMVQEGSSPDYTILFVRCVLTGNAEAGIGLICACLPALSRYISSKRAKTRDSDETISRHHDNSWQKMSASSNLSGPVRTSRTLPKLSPEDQIDLISMAEFSTPAETREPRGGLSPQDLTHLASDGIYKSITLSHTYEHIAK